MDRDGQLLWQSFCATADEVSFEALYENYRSLVWTLCWRVLGTEEDARDAFQSAWTRIYALAREEGSRVANELVAPLIYRLSIREADALKKRRMRRGRREIMMDELPVVPSGAVPADEMAAAAERRTRLETVIAMLPDKYRLPIQLHYLHGMTQVQIAQMMDIPRATVAARLTRGLRKLTPLAERAGLSDMASLLGVAAVGGMLMAPPKALAATAVFLQIQSAIAAGASTAALAAGASATLSKTVLGIAVIKAKIALVSAVLFVAATAIGLHYYKADHAAKTQAVASVTTTVVRPAPAPTAVVVNNFSADSNAKKPTVTKEMPKPTPTVAPTPEGPMRDIRVAVIWEDTQRAVEGTTVSMQSFTATDNLFPKAAKTNAEGIAIVKIPEEWAKARVRCQHADSLQNVYKPFEAAKVEQPIMMVLKRGGRAYGMVRLADGRPAAGAEVQAWNADQLRRSVTAKDGSFEICQLHPGDTRFISILQNLRSDIKNPKGLTYRTNVGQKVGPVVLTLEPGLTLSGIVTAAKTGQVVPGAVVTIPNDSRFQKVKTISDLGGRFTIEGLPQARVTVLAKAENYAGQARIVQPAPGTISKCDFALNPGGEIEATVVDQKGNPVENASVSVSYNRNYMLREDTPAKTDSSGRATVKNLATDDQISLSASKNPTGSAYQQVDFPPGELKTAIKLTLKPTEEQKTGYIVGTVSDENGKPLPDINLYYGYPQTNGTITPTTRTDAGGKYQIETKNNQSYLSAYGSGWGTEMKNSVSLGTKEKPVVADFILKPGHYLAGTVVDEKDSALPNLQVSLSPYNMGNSLPNSNAKTDASGKFRIENLPDAQFSVSFSGDDIPSQSEQASIDTETRFVLKPMGSIKGRVLDKATKKPVEAFAIKISGNSIDYNLQTTGQAFSDPDGKFEIKQLKKDDAYDLLVESKGYSSHTESKVLAKAGEAADEVTVYVSQGDALRGILIDEKTNTPVAGALLVYGNPQNSGWFSWRMLTDRGYDYAMKVVSRAVTGLDGRFELNIDDGHQTLYILPRAHKRMILSESDRAKFKRDKEYIITAAPGAQITGKGFLDGKIQPDAQVYLNQIRATDNGQSSVDFGEVKTDAQGVFSIGGLDAGEYNLSGPIRRAANYGIYAYTRKVTLKDGEKKEINLGDNLGQCLLAGAVLNGGQPVPNAHITLNPAFTWEYTSISGASDQNGVYAIDGLVPGKYNASVSKLDDNSGMNRFQVNEIIEIKGASTEHNFEKGGHKVTGRLVFDENTDPAQRAAFKTAQITVTNFSGQQTEAGPRIDQYATCDIKAGVLTFEGQLKGEYRITISGNYQAGNMSSMALPQKFDIDSTQADVDLGDIVVPASGRIKLTVRNADPSVKMRFLQAVVMPAGNTGNTRPTPVTNLQIDPNKGEQSVGPVPVGNFEIHIVGDGCRCDPPSIPVTVTAGQEAGPLSFTVTPSSDVIVLVMSPDVNLQSNRPGAIPGSRVTLSGNGVQRQLLASDAPLNEQTAMAAYASNRDVAFGPAFVFRNLPEGNYAITVDAPGYKTSTQQTSAAKGKTAQVQVKLLKQ